MTIFPQVLLNVRVKEKKEFSSIPEVSKAIKDCEDKLKDRGRILVRYSGTEPLARVMIEGENEGKIKTMAEEIAGTIKEAIG